MKNTRSISLTFLITISAVLFPSVSHTKSSLDSLRTLVKNSQGEVQIENSINLAKKLIEYSKIREGLSVANDVLISGKKNNDQRLQLQAYSIISRGYLIAGDIRSAITYGDSSMQLARKSKDKYGLGLAYQAYGPPQMYLGDVKTAVNMLDSSLIIFTEEDYPIERATSKLLMASTLATSGQAESSLPFLDDAKRLFEENNDHYKAATIDLNLGMIRGTILGQYEDAIKISLRVLPYFEHVQDSLKIATCNNTIATCYDATGNYDKAIIYLKSAIDMMGSGGNILMKANFYNNLGEVYKHKKDFEHAYEYYKKALDIFSQYGLVEGMIVAENNIGECFLSRGEYENALTYFQNSLDKVDKQNDHYKLAILYKNIGKVYLNIKEYSKAILYLNKSVAEGTSIGIPEEVFPAYEYLAEAYAKNGDFRNAYKYHVLFSEAKDEFTKVSNAEKISEIDTKYQTVKKEKEIELLKKNHEIQELQLSRQLGLVIALIILSIVIGGFSIIIYKRYKDNKKLNAILERQKDELNFINEQLTKTNEKLTASEKDLKHLNATKDKFFSIIAHDLKGPFSSLLGLTEIMKEDTETISADELRKMSEGIYNASRKVYALTENLLEWSRSQLNMLNIKKESFDLNELVKNNVRLYKNIIQSKRITLNKELSLESFVNTDKDIIDFTLRNLLHNAIKFTKNDGEIKISTIVEKDFMNVEVSDTGIGIPEGVLDKLFTIESAFASPGTEEEKGTGLGLILTREFIEKIGGQISVRSKVNHGTTFTFTIPMTN